MDDGRGVTGQGEGATGVDPVALEIIRGGLRAIQSEMEVLIERTAMSAFIREKKDYASGLYDAAGRMIAGKALPFASDLVTPVFGHYPPETMRPGDIYWYNDCYASRGAVTHTPDQVLIELLPFFRLEDRKDAIGRERLLILPL